MRAGPKAAITAPPLDLSHLGPVGWKRVDAFAKTTYTDASLNETSLAKTPRCLALLCHCRFANTTTGGPAWPSSPET